VDEDTTGSFAEVSGGRHHMPAPDVILADAESKRRRGAFEQLVRVESLREERSHARSEGRWLA